MRRPILLPALALVALLLAVPASASGALRVGISENNPEMFSDPLFTPLGVKQTRVVVSFDVMSAAARGDDEINRVTRYINAANATGVEPLVSFEHARGDASVCKKKSNHSLPQCVLPTLEEYAENIRAFLVRFPTVKVISPWNEWNHFTQPTSRNPKRAAQFTDLAIKICKELNRGCKVVVMDVLDQADKAKAKTPTFKSTTRMIKTFKKTLKAKRTVCGIHNYSDTNRFRDTGTRALIKALGCREYWLTETGGVYNFGSFKASESRQLKATKYMFKLARSNRKIKRLYVYTWFGFPGPAGININPRFDAGLISGGKPRAAYAEVKKRI